MTALVVYHSITGQARAIAEAVAAAAGADSEIIQEAKSGGGRMGFKPNVLSGAPMPEQISALRHDPKEYDLVAVGTPLEGGALPEAVRSFLQLYRNQLPDVAFFVVGEGTDNGAVFDEMSRICEKRPFATAVVPQSAAEHPEQSELTRFAETLRHH